MMAATSSLRQRVMTAVVLIPLTAWGIILLPTPYVALLFGFVMLAGAWEWAGLIGWRSATRRALYAAVMAPLLYGAYVASAAPAGALAVLGAGLLWWLVALVWVLRFQQGAEVALIDRPAVGVVAGWLLLVPAWLALVRMHGWAPGGPLLVLFLLVLIWAADTGAYFAGRRWGVSRMASRVSPGKTWAGAAGGFAGGGVVAAAAGAYLYSGLNHVLSFVILCLAAVAVSIVGDLAESLFKRRAGVKDSGELLPGHGGVLDRIDSLTAAAPFFVLGLYWLGKLRT